MGHLFPTGLPKTHRWKQVIQTIEKGGSVDDIAEASAIAAENALSKVPADGGFVLALTNIFKFIEAAQSKDFEKGLESNGFSVGFDGSVFDIVSGLRAKIDSDIVENKAPTHLAEIAQNSFSENLIKYVSINSPTLFRSTTADLHQSIREQLSKGSLKGMMHEFFTTFTTRYLSYYLSRELPNHIGPGRRFNNIGQHGEFGEAFNLYIRQTVRIAEEFTPGWFGKAKYEKRLEPEAVARYSHVAFEKIISEFRRGAKPDG